MAELQTTVLVPAEPTGLFLLVTGLITIGGYLLATGKWRELRQHASPYFANVLRARDVEQRDRPTYDFCSYESRFAYSLGTIRSTLARSGEGCVVKRPEWPTISVQHA